MEYRVFEIDEKGTRFFVKRYNSFESARYFVQRDRSRRKFVILNSFDQVMEV